MAGNKFMEVALKIVDLLAKRPDLRQTEIARALSEYDSTVMRALPVVEALGVRLAEDENGKLSLAE